MTRPLSLLLGALATLTACGHAPSLPIPGRGPAPAAVRPLDAELAILAPGTSDRSATGNAKTNTMTLEEVRGCAVRIIDLDKADTLIRVERSRTDRERARVERIRDSIEIVRPFLNNRSKPAVDAFNRRIDQQRTDQTALTGTTDRLARLVAEDAASRTAFLSACGGRPYRRTQNETLPAPLRAAIDRNSCAGFVPVRDR